MGSQLPSRRRWLTALTLLPQAGAIFAGAILGILSPFTGASLSPWTGKGSEAPGPGLESLVVFQRPQKWWSLLLGAAGWRAEREAGFLL